METADQTLENFIEQLLDEKQFKNLEPEVREQLRQDLQSRAEDHINAALLAELSEEELKEFENLVDTGKEESTLQNFLIQHIPEMSQVVAGTLLRFRDSYVGK